MADRRKKKTPLGPTVFEIRVQAWLEFELAQKWFPGMSLHHEDSGETILRGPLPDQAALFGILHRLRDLAIPIVSIQTVTKPFRKSLTQDTTSSASAEAKEQQGWNAMTTNILQKNPYPLGEAVLVTGCSSGIGQATALYLAQHGFLVLATVRKETDAERLRAFHLPQLEVVCPLDLALPEQIGAAAAQIRRILAERGRDRLYGIVNNAGGGFIAPVELMDLGKFRGELETRVLGPIALLQELLPLLRRARDGRILWISTPALIPIPYVSSIHASEFAMTCIARSLHLELSPWKVPNILIGCGGIHTAAPSRTEEELESAYLRWPREKLDLYSHSLQKTQQQFADFDAKRTDPEAVALVVREALCARKPRRKYLVGHQATLMNMLRILPQSMVEWIFTKRI